GRVELSQELGRRQPVERMLQQTAASEAAGEVRRAIPAGLVVRDLITSVRQPIDPVDPTAGTEAQAVDIDEDGLGAGERLALDVAGPEADLEADRCPTSIQLESQEEVEVAEDLGALALEDVLRRRRHESPQLHETRIPELPQPHRVAL